jgi:hypothetical protein
VDGVYGRGLHPDPAVGARGCPAWG